MADAVKSNPEVQAQPDGMRSRPIDLVYLSRQTLGDPGLESEILILFSQMASTYLKRAVENTTPEDRKMALHALKGAAAGIGAGAVADTARDAETEMRDTGKVSEEALGDLAMAVEEVRSFISQLLAK